MTRHWILLGVLLFLFSFRGTSQSADLCKSDAIRFEWDQDYVKSAALYEKAALLYEEEGKIDTLCFFKAGQNYVRIKQFAQAIPMLQRVVALEGSGQEGWFYVAEALSGDGRYNEAQTSLDEGMGKFPNEGSPFLQKKAEIAYEAGKFEEALVLVDKALEKGEAAGLWSLKAHILERSGQNRKAIEVYRQMLEANPGDESLTLKTGFLIFKSTDDDYKAEKTRYTALKNPSRVDYSNSRKKLEKVAQGYNEAIPLLESALEAKPGDTSILKCLYISYSRVGNKVKEAEFKQKLGL
jgi:tetratricopeptide (TPR) repeat protein